MTHGIAYIYSFAWSHVKKGTKANELYLLIWVILFARATKAFPVLFNYFIDIMLVFVLSENTRKSKFVSFFWKKLVSKGEIGHLINIKNKVIIPEKVFKGALWFLLYLVENFSAVFYVL